jgi:hypothetical protein
MPNHTVKKPPPARPARRRASRVAAERESRYWEMVTAAWLNERFGRPASAPVLASRGAATRRATPTASRDRHHQRAAATVR